ncbi:MarR family transcriptional regulator [Salinisphaera sp. T31B1]|uniref:MarR family winged helix-turn-helix transcriptional regulator n=1 Tax=Salinisphaera sp. T31B1 TaxID=727963 RepID=UPI00333EE3EB
MNRLNGTATISCTHLKLQCVSRVVARHYDAYLADSGLRGSQYALLCNIQRHEPVRPSDLASRLFVNNSTITRTIRTLRRRGLVACIAGNDDRSRHVSLTEEGRRTLQSGQRDWRRAQRALAARLGTADVGQLHELLDRVADLLEQP